MQHEDNGIRSATFIRTKDGDTFECHIRALPLRIRPKLALDEQAIRVRGWNAKELSEQEGPHMRDEFDRMLRTAEIITVRLTGNSFERIVADVYLDDVLFAGLLRAELRRLRIRLARRRQENRHARTDTADQNHRHRIITNHRRRHPRRSR